MDDDDGPTSKSLPKARRKPPPNLTRRGKLSNLSQEERKEYRRQQQQESYKKHKAKTEEVRPYTHLAGLTETERKERRREQKEACRVRIVSNNSTNKPTNSTMSQTSTRGHTRHGGTSNGADADEMVGGGTPAVGVSDSDETVGTPETVDTALIDVITSLKEQVNYEELQAEAADTADFDTMKKFWEEEDRRLERKLKDSNNEMLEQHNKSSIAAMEKLSTQTASALATARRERRQDFDKFMTERRSARAIRTQSRQEFLTQQVQKYSAAKKPLHTEGKIRRQRLKETQHVTLADTLTSTNNVVASPEADTLNGTENTSPGAHTWASTNKVVASPEADTLASTSLEPNGTEESTEAPPILEAPPIKSAFKTPTPKPTFVQRMFGSGQKKKRASFGPNQVKNFTPPNSDEKKAMHGATRTETFQVVVTDMPVYKVWRGYFDGEFVRNFASSFPSLLDEPEAGCQILYAAHVMNLLRDLDSEKVRQLAAACFPKYKRSFPRLVDKHGRCNKEVFLAYLKKRLDDHAVETFNLEEDKTNPKFVYPDFVTMRERHYKRDELKHLKTPSP